MATLLRMPLNAPEIKRRREKLTLTMQEAADRATRALKAAGHKTGFTRQRWYDIESGRYGDSKLSTLEAVCEVLGCGVDDIRTPLALGRVVKGSRR